MGGGTGSNEKAKYTVTINLSPDINPGEDFGLKYYSKTTYVDEILNSGDELVVGTKISCKSTHAYKFYANGVEFDYNGF